MLSDNKIKRRISQALSIILSNKKLKYTKSNSMLLLLPMGLGDAVMFLDSIDYYFSEHQFDEIILMTTKAAVNVFRFARPALSYTIVEYDAMKMDTSVNYFMHYLNILGKRHYKKIVYPLRGFLTMDLLYSRLRADEKICIDTLKEQQRKRFKVKVRDKLIKNTTILKFKPSDMDLIRYAKVASFVCNKSLKSKLPKIDLEKSSSERTYCQISVGSSRPEKCWPIERYADIVKYLLNNSLYDIVFTGSKEDYISVAKIITQFDDVNKRLINKCGQTSLEELFNIILNAKFILGGDSGPIHMAVALNTPSVCIVGGWDYERVFPYRVEVLENERFTPITVNTGVKDCYRCLLLHGQRGATNGKCLKMINDGKACLCIEDIDSDLVIETIRIFL